MATGRILFGGPRSAALTAAFALALASPARAPGQETGPAREADAGLFPSHGFLISGYGSAGYNVTFGDDETPNDFVASLNPLLLFQISDRFLFEAELEFELEEGVTETGLEYAQIDYSLNNNLKLVAGKFLLPFNIFSERLHPSWITRFTTPPPLYGHGLGTGPAAPLLPILTDVGAQLRGSFNLGEFGYLTAVGFVTQGPRLEAEEHGEEGAEEGDGGAMEEPEIPEVAFGTNFEDLNEDKMVGGRLGVGIAPYVEANVSAMRGDYDEEGRLAFTALGAHLELRHRGLELHSEWIRTEQEISGHEDPTEVMTLARDGYFARLGYRIGKWEPLVRWTQIFAGEIGEETAVESGEQLTLALDYWLTPSLVLKGEYSFNFEDADVDNDRLAVQWAFGF